MVSVLIPVYNQYDELSITLDALSRQDYPDSFEVVVADDGSDCVGEQVIDKYSSVFNYSLIYIESLVNMGRAATRNKLVEGSKGDILIFCDADRFPSVSFISDHVQCIHNSKRGVSIGKVMETYESAKTIKEQTCKKWVSRKAVYYKTIQKMFNSNGESDSCLTWLAFLSGNLAIERKELGEERFDESFHEWGFEHFELGYRLVKKGMKIILNSGAINTHIAHKRGDMEYEKCILDSYTYFYEKHPEMRVKNLYNFLMGEISLQQYEILCDGPKTWMSDKKPIYNVII